MGEILKNSECYFLQWWGDQNDEWGFSLSADSLQHAKMLIKKFKIVDGRRGKKFKYRVVKETTMRKVVYDE